MKKITISKPHPVDNKDVFQIEMYNCLNLGSNETKTYNIIPLIKSIVYNRPVNYQVTLINSKKNARLILCSPYNMEYQIFPNAYFNEIILMIWDCWPIYINKVVSCIKRCNVNTIIFTSQQTADCMKKIFPKKNIIYIPEGINTKHFTEKIKPLINREIDILQYGRTFDIYSKALKYLSKNNNYNIISSNNNKTLFTNYSSLIKTLYKTKIVLAFPRCDTNPELAGNIETLTQRYWECMLSGVIMLGRAPSELIELIGYNPVIEINLSTFKNQVNEIIKSPSLYQNLIQQNYNTALKFAGWQTQINNLSTKLNKVGYELKI